MCFDLFPGKHPIPDHGGYTNLVGKVIQVFTLYNAGTHLGHESFIAVGEFAEQVVCHNCIQYCIAQILQAFIVNVMLPLG